MHRMKTGALIRAAVLLGASCGRALPRRRGRARSTGLPRRGPRLPGGRRRARRGGIGGYARQDRRQGRGAEQADVRHAAGARRGEAARRGAARRGACRARALRHAARGGCSSSPTGSRSASTDRMYPLLERIDSPADLRAPRPRAAAASSRASCAASSSIRSRRPAGTCRPTSAPSSSRSRCTTSSTRRRTASCGTSATRPTPTRSSPAAARRWRSCGRWDGVAASRAASESGVRHLRHRAFVDVDLGGARHGGRRQAEGRDAPRRRRDRRRRDERGHGVRGAQQRRHSGANLLVILNDNDMSISEPVGALEQLPREDPVAAACTTRCAAAARKCCRGCRRCTSSPSASRSTSKGMVLPGTLFEEFGFNYIGPDRRPRPRRARAARSPTCATCRARSSCTSITRKGYGYPRPRRIRSSTTASASSIRRSASSRRPPRKPDVHAGLRRLAVRHGGDRLAHRRHHARDARGLGARAVLAGISRTATSTSASPSSTRSRSRRASRAKA